jgi:hypothetical protein
VDHKPKLWSKYKVGHFVAMPKKHSKIAKCVSNSYLPLPPYFRKVQQTEALKLVFALAATFFAIFGPFITAFQTLS